jgi:diacylglycerol kinase family enzyme
LDLQLGFGLSRFDDQMIVILMEKWPGPWKFFLFFINYMLGQVAKDWKEGNLPDYIHIQKTNKYTLDGKESFDMYLDGGGTCQCQGKLPVTLEVIPDAIPYFVHDGAPEIDRDTKKVD